MKKTILVLLTIFALNLNAQNLFPVKLENCKTDRFVLIVEIPKQGLTKVHFQSYKMI